MAVVRELILSVGALLASGCALVTTWGDLPLGTIADAGADGPIADASPPDADAAPDAAPPCKSGQDYCGGDGIVGDPSTLFSCLADGGTKALVYCAKGCVRRQPKTSDACKCVAGGYYCGDDNVVGDPGSLYVCNADLSATLVKVCAHACVVNTNNDDGCN